MDFVRTRRTRLRKFRFLNRFSRMSRLEKISLLTRVVFFGLIGLVILTIALFIWFGRDLPTPGKLIAAQATSSSGIYDRNGTLLYSVYQNQNRTYVSLSSIPKVSATGNDFSGRQKFLQQSRFFDYRLFKSALNIVLL